MELLKIDRSLFASPKTYDWFEDFFSISKKKSTHFILVSVEKYTNYGIDFHNENRSAKELEMIFKKYLTHERNTITHLYDQKATKQNIYQTLISYEKSSNEDDSIIIYFSGLSCVNAKNNRYFIPSDAHNIDDCISHEDILSSIQTINARNILATFDWKELNQIHHAHFNELTNLSSIIDLNISLSKNNSDFITSLITFFSTPAVDFVRNSFLFIKSELGLVSKNTIKKIDIKNLEYLKEVIVKKDYHTAINILTKSLEKHPDFNRDILEIKDLISNYDILKRRKEDFRKDVEILDSSINEKLNNLVSTLTELGIAVVILPNIKVSPMKKKKILVTSANPINTTWLRLDKEIRKIEEEINKAGYRESFEIIKVAATRIGDLQDALLKHSPNFVHFSGHGCKDGICLINENDTSNIILNEPLSKLFSLFSSEIECVFLNSCYSKEQSELIRKNIPKVIGMKDSVSDETAIEFAAAFYKAIASNKSVDFSFQFAINSIDLKQLEGSDIPVLLS